MSVEYIERGKHTPKTRMRKVSAFRVFKGQFLKKGLIIVLGIYILFLVIPKPILLYETLGGVVPLEKEAKSYPRTDYHDYVEPKQLTDGTYDFQLDPKINLESNTASGDMVYQGAFALANVEFVYEQLKERTGQELIDPVRVNIKDEQRKLGGGYATDKYLVVRLDGTKPANFDKSYLVALITHEFFHVIHLQHAYQEGTVSTTPQWFLEGVAVYFAEPSSKYFSGEFINLKYITLTQMEYEHTTTHLRTSYETAGEFINYIADKYGEDKLVELIFEPQSANFDKEFERIYGKSKEAMYRQWYFWGMHTGL